MNYIVEQPCMKHMVHTTWKSAMKSSQSWIKREYQKLMKFINTLDSKAFITVYNVSDMRYQPKI